LSETGQSGTGLGDLMRGKLDKFSLDALVNLAAAAGLTLKIQIEDAA